MTLCDGKMCIENVQGISILRCSCHIKFLWALFPLLDADYHIESLLCNVENHLNAHDSLAGAECLLISDVNIDICS